MAVYEGARPRTIAIPRSERAPRATRGVAADVPALPRRRARATIRAHRRPNRLALVLGAIVVTFMLAFFFLAQEVRVSATTYDISRLQLERDRLDADLAELQSDLHRLGREPAIRKLGLDAGLGQLDDAVVLPAR
jgi:hypothetical protein